MKINQTFKNLQRLRQIGMVLAKHGFKNLVDDIGLGNYIPFQKPVADTGKRSTPERLRMAFEELGTTFIKLGQMLSIRPDLIPREFVDEFRKLQDQVRPEDFDKIRGQIVKEFDIEPEEIFASIDTVPIGAASIAQVYRAELPDGRDVVVKVRRPNIQKAIETDLSILFTLAHLLDRYTDLISVVNPIAIVDEFASLIRYELDFIREGQNVVRFGKNFADEDHVVIPEVVWEFTGKRVLTMSYLDGIPLKDTQRLRNEGRDLRKLADRGLETFFKMVFVHGFFHGDIHGGNILVLGEDKIGLIDFGIAGQFDQRLLEDVASLFISLVTKDFRSLARHYLRMSTFTSDPVSPDALARELQRVVEPMMGLSLKDIDSAELLMELASIAQRNRLQIPQELLLLFRAVVTLDSIGRELDPEFDVIDSASSFARTIMLERYKPERIAVDVISVLRDMADMGRDMPAQIQAILDRTEKGGLIVDARVRDGELYAAIRREGWRISSVILIAAASVTLGLISNGEGFGIVGVIGILMLLFGIGGLSAPWFFKDGKGPR